MSRVALDAGHCLTHPGAYAGDLRGSGLIPNLHYTPGFSNEADLTADMVARIGHALRGLYKVETVETRNELAGNAANLNARPATAHDAGAVCFVSVHYDSTSEQANGHGLSVRVQPAHSVRDTELAASVKAHALGAVNDHGALGWRQHQDRGTVNQNLAVLRGCKRYGIPAILVECAFCCSHSVERDRDLYTRKAWRELLAEGIAKGIAEFVT